MHNANTSFCRIANKVAMHVRYVTTTSDQRVAKSMIDEAFLLTLELFNQTDSSALLCGYRDDCERAVIARERSKITPATVSRWNAHACEQLRSFGLQERLIAVLGDEMERWDYSIINADSLIEHITDFAGACSANAATTSESMMAETGQTSIRESKIDGFWKAVCGLAILLTSITQPTPAPEHDEFPTRSVLTCFGGFLVADYSQRFKCGS